MRRGRFLGWCGAAATLTCLAGAAAVRMSGVAMGAALTMAAVAALIAFTRVSVDHASLVRQLRRRSTMGEVAGAQLRVGHLGGSAFVAGLARPEIFCDRNLLGDLDDHELVAVVMHERAHQLARDPLRSTFETAVSPLLKRSRRGRRWSARRVAAREIGADRYAINQGVDPQSIASALLKVPPTGPLHTATFTPSVELRLRALLGDEVVLTHTRGPWRAIATGTVIGLALCITMSASTLGIAGILRWCCTG